MEIDNTTYVEARRSLDKVNSGNETEVPPYMTVDEWKTQLALQVDEVENPEMIFCGACDTYHTVQH